MGRVALRTLVKICGLARPQDAASAARLGADFLGLVFAESPRRVRLRDALPWVAEVRAEFPAARWVGVFVSPDALEVEETAAALALDFVQVHGTASVPPSMRGRTILALPADQVRAAMESDRRDGAGDSGRESRTTRTEVGAKVGGDEESEERGGADAAAWAYLADHPSGAGGTGRSYSHESLRGWRAWAGGRRLFLAGGLGPDNVAAAIGAVRPFAVDASSRLEESPGRKDPRMLSAFFAAIRGASGRTDPAPRGGGGSAAKESS